MSQRSIPVPPAAPAAPWRDALNAAIAADPAGKQGVALRLGVSRPYVSRVTTGHIPQAPAKFIARVAEVYLRVDCPHLGHSLSPQECRSYAGRSYAAITQPEVAHWRACRHCLTNPIAARAAALGLPAADTAQTPEVAP